MRKVALKRGLQNIISDLSDKFWLEKAVDNYLENGFKESKRSPGFHASSSGMCPRLIQLQMNKVISQKVDARGRRIFDMGHSVHDRYGVYFKKADVLLECEAKMKMQFDDMVIVGSADFIVKDEQDKKWIVEFKSINARRFADLIATRQPRPEHVLQLNLYLKGLGIHDGIVAYECKNTQELKFFTIRYDEELFNKVFNMFKMIHDCNKKSILVPKPDKCPDPRWCPAKSYCKGK